MRETHVISDVLLIVFYAVCPNYHKCDFWKADSGIALHHPVVDIDDEIFVLSVLAMIARLNTFLVKPDFLTWEEPKNTSLLTEFNLTTSLLHFL